MKTILLSLAACAPLIALAAPTVNLVDISKSGVPGKTFAASTSMPASVANVCAAIQDFAAYPQFMPNVDKITVAPGGAGTSLVDITLKLPMGKIKRYRLKMTPRVTDASCQLAWKLVPMEGLKPDETIADTSGAWQLAPDAKDPSRTAVKYQVYTDPGPVPMGFGWIVDSMSRDSIPKMFDALRARVAASLMLDEQGRATARAQRPGDDAVFYASRETFWIGHLCNHWTADLLSAAGLPIRPWRSLTSGEVMRTAARSQVRAAKLDLKPVRD